MSTETFLHTIWQTVWTYVQQFVPAELATATPLQSVWAYVEGLLPAELTSLAPGNDAMMWALGVLVVVGALWLVGTLAGE